MTTFADLGIAFKLFEAPVEDASDYIGVQNCDLCGLSDRHCFRCGVGAYIKTNCSKCGLRKFVQGCDAFGAQCDQCGSKLLDQTGPEEHPLVCFDCLRSGQASITKDTEFGMVTYQEASKGQTHGVPGLTTTMFETVPTGDGEWMAAKVPSEHLTELTRTPGYHSWQGDIWLFCCKTPMVFCGEWKQPDFEAQAADGDALSLARSMVAVDEHRYWGDAFPDQLSFYVFRCQQCDGRRAHTDMS